MAADPVTLLAERLGMQASKSVTVLAESHGVESAWPQTLSLCCL